MHLTTTKELDRRESNGIEVTLLWDESTNCVAVSVIDAHGMWFTLEVAPEDALDAFHHPYAYAAFSGVDTELAELDLPAAA